MRRMDWWLLCWLVPSLLSHSTSSLNTNHCDVTKRQDVLGALRCMEQVDRIMKKGNFSEAIEAIETLEQVLEETEVNDSMPLPFKRFVVLLYKPKGPFRGLDIYASDIEISDMMPKNCKVRVRLPEALYVRMENTIVFCMLTWPEINLIQLGALGGLYESRMIGLTVRAKTISGLKEPVNITVNVTGNDTHTPVCAFLNFTTKQYSTDGCLTVQEHGNITCSCDHLTYFAVLLVSTPPSPGDQKILTYITLIGCSLSLVGLVITVLLFVINRKVKTDTSIKIHINLIFALILLNVSFLPSQMVAAMSSTWFCFHMAYILHYTLLATFCWMAVEGFHLYLLLVRVFNIYVRKYLLKLSVVGWGIPAVIVLLVISIDRKVYGHVPLDWSNPNSTEICYIGNYTVKMVTTVGVFGLVFLFNIVILGVTIRHVFRRTDKTIKRDICTLLGITVLLGVTWGLAFFSFGDLTTPGLYLFCIMNPLQGFFIFLWFMMLLRKAEDPPTKISSELPTNS